jgi:hypothetical protein
MVSRASVGSVENAEQAVSLKVTDLTALSALM